MMKGPSRRAGFSRLALVMLPLLIGGGCGNQKANLSPVDAAHASTPDAAGGTGVGAAAGTAGAPGVVGTGGAAVVPDAGLDGPEVSVCPTAPSARPAGTPTWEELPEVTDQQAWYATPAAAYVFANVMFYQNANGGWPKNIDMTFRFGVDEAGMPKNAKSMIDNNATTTQLRLLASALGSWPACERYQAAFDAGMRFLFDAQYPGNGGWPQVWPLEPSNYSRHITYNDDAMVHVMEIMRDIAYGAPAFKFVSPAMHTRATTALNKGIDCMLKTQIVVAGVKTGWCAQHDVLTLLPAAARPYELPSQSGKEGAQIMAFLMGIDLARADVPRQAIIDAVEAAVRFYDSVKLTGIRYFRATGDAGLPDSWIEAASNAPPIWARFYELEPPYRPFFSDRDGIKVYSLAEVGLERRGGYSWYVSDARSPLSTTYPGWVNRWKIGRNVLVPQ